MTKFRPKLVVVDTETGGLDPEKESILTLAAVIWHEGGIEDSIEIRIAEPEIVANQGALRVNGIDLDELRREGVSPLTAVNTLENFLQKHDLRRNVMLAGHNLAFDVGFLKRLYRLAQRDYSKRFTHRGVCTQSAAVFLNLCGILDVRGFSGDVLFRHFGITPEERAGNGGKHTALGDATATAHLLTRLTRLISGWNVPSVADGGTDSES